LGTDFKSVPEAGLSNGVKERKREISSNVKDIVSKVLDEFVLIRDEIICLLKIRLHFMNAGLIMTAANVRINSGGSD